MSEQQPGVLQKLVKFLGGLAGVTAGISTVFSVAGFLLLYAHADLLGLSDLFHHSVTQYLYKGGAFFIGTFFCVPHALIGNPYGLTLLGLLALYVVITRVGGEGYRKISLHAATRFRTVWGRWLSLLLAIFLVLIFIRHALVSFPATDLLFLADRHPELVKRATADGKQALQNQYIYAMLHCLLAMLLVWGVNHLHKGPDKRSPLAWLFLFGHPSAPSPEKGPANKPDDLFSVAGCLLLYLLLMLQLLLLPLQYGRTIYPNTFHRVTEVILDEKLQGKIPRSEEIWLLNERPGGELVLYFKDTQEVVLMPKKFVLSFKIRERENIFLPN